MPVKKKVVKRKVKGKGLIRGRGLIRAGADDNPLGGARKKRVVKKKGGAKLGGAKANIARFKKAQAIAKKIKKKHPDMKHTTAVSKAWKEMKK